MNKDTDRILVTGGAGFIGSHLVEELLRRGHGVTVIDDCSTGSLNNLSAVLNHPGLRLIQSTVTEVSDLPVICSSVKFVYHLAAAVGVELVVHSPIHTIQTNLQEAEMVFLAASTTQTPVLFTSTSEVYGKSSKAEFEEEDDLLIGPPHLGRWSYACSKLMDEFLALAYARERKLPVIIARLFNTVGPRQSGQYGMVVPRFISAALRGEPIKVFGTGNQTRCFCHVNDTVEALVRLKDTTTARGEIFNVGSTAEISINELALKVIEQLGSKSEIQYVPYAEAYAPGFEDMQRRKPRISKLQQQTGFSPRIALDEIIASTAEYQRKQLRSAAA
jgi:UDP-glucose 4-epimerase